MTKSPLRIERDGRVLVLTFNRPEQLNAMNDVLYDASAAALRAATLDTDVAVVIVTGEGRAFCAGQDLGEMSSRPTYPAGEIHGFTPFMDALENFDKPLIAAINGMGIGIGLTMLPYCDFVFIDKTARLRAPFVTLGVTAEAGSTYLLPAMIGWMNAADILYTARWIDADDAVALGVAREKTPAGEAAPRAKSLARDIARNPIASLVATKRLMLASRADAVRAARAREMPAFAKLEGGPANREALAAFREKRAPDFTGL